MTFATEPLQVVEIIQPLCSRVFGADPCMADGQKCFNTDATCSFRTALDMTDSIALRFVADGFFPWRDEVDAFQPSLAIPALRGYKTAPTLLNIAAGSQDVKPLGYRAVCTAQISDFPWNDYETDPYVADRSYDPEARGSFWSKWLARNPFHIGYLMRIYEGQQGDALSDMIMREYVIEKIDFGRDGVTIRAKDILRRITDTEISAPILSTGELASDINSNSTTFEVAGAVLADYDAAGSVRIGDEMISYTSVVEDGGNLEFSGGERGFGETVATKHDATDRVQSVWTIDAVPFHDILYDLLVTRGGIDPSYIDYAAWQDEYEDWRPTYIFSGVINQPTKIEQLLGEICTQALSSIWWDERTQKIIMRAQRPNFAPALITGDRDIVAGSLAIVEKPEQRVSEVRVYYELVTGISNPLDRSSYSRVAVFIDVDKQIQYGGEAAVRSIYCRFVRTEAIANSIASTYLNRFKDVRRHVTFKLSANNASDFWTGDSLFISHYLDVDFTGAPKTGNWQIISAQANAPGSEFMYTAEDNTSNGIIWYWVDETVPPFATASEEQKATIGYWTDEDGSSPDGVSRGFGWL